jgi:ketol-acid reductoisomerase
MPAKVYTDADADISVLQNKTLAVLGFGSQGHAHALNLKESGLNVIIGLYEGSKSIAVAEDKGFEVFPTGEAVRRADIIFVALPDTKQAAAYKAAIAPNLAKGKTLLFSHGFSIHFKTVVPPKFVDVILVAPKGPGHIVRRQFTEGKGVPSLIAVFQNPSKMAKQVALRGPKASVARAPALSRRPSRKKPRPTCSASKRCFAAAPLRWCRPDMRLWWKPVTNPRWPTSNACTN